MRRARLVEQAALQRTALAREAAALRAPLRWASRVCTAAAYLTSNPLPLIVLAGIFVFRRPRRVTRWVKRGWIARELVRAALHR
jgi:hypothetical protein